MKILMTVLAFITASAFARADITKFQGNTYKKADYAVCLQDLDSILKRVENVDGFRVLDGGCQSDWMDGFTMVFNYIHPLATTIEDFSVSYLDEVTCLNASKTAQEEMLASGNSFITSYCKGKELTTHYVDTTFSMVRSLNKLGKFKTLADCSAFLTDMTKRIKKFKMTSFMSHCQETQFEPTGKQYAPVLNYIAFHEIDIKVINGKTSATSCLNNRQGFEENFSANEITVVHMYCPEVMGAGHNLQETILYLNPTKVSKYIVNYEGIVFSTPAECEVQLEKAVTELNHVGKNVLYGFCRASGEKYFTPTITYLGKVE